MTGAFSDSRRRPRVVLAVLALAAAATFSGCANGGNTVAQEAKDPGQARWTAGDGQAATIPAAERGEPVTLTGTTLAGQPWSMAEQQGQVVVLNVWSSTCNPCKTEMPALQKIWVDLQGRKQPVRFIGVNRFDSVESALADVRTYGLTYPSLANDGGRALLALRGQANALPTTLILDRQGRIAAKYGGAIEASTLTALIKDAVAEDA